VDVVAIRAALRVPSPRQPVDAEPSRLMAAIADYTEAVRRHTRAETEAALSRRPSTMKAALKTAEALDGAQAHLMSELRLIGLLVDDAVDALAAAKRPGVSASVTRLHPHS
jgi:hypothetical protein